ncbi:FAD-dependent oxidoreductase [Streptomyces sp. CA-278952]|uniref:NAD(P)/FAD-dependent oxidoreductase n=1 Tax=Streptomyces sp. CA-278952 TaxID=2980556 RepID=UPI002367475F|nr:FAD-dependent oxidoreductase [Streptomyces sp. CA-278952]WDG29445.1 FAD-dependent oxidoreductase [Streptomyces sp. CA-278952]
MLVLLDHPVPTSVEPLLNGAHVLHRPALGARPGALRGRELARTRPDVLLTRSLPAAAETAAWGAAAGERPLVVVLLDRAAGPGGPRRSAARVHRPSARRLPGAGPAGSRLRVTACPSAGAAEPPADLYARALATAERRFLAERVGPVLAGRLGAVRQEAASVVLVGAGVVNLLTGLRLLRAGHRVSFYDSGPDPRSDAPWTSFGCSRGGGDARMFTLTEADGYFGSPGGGPPPFTQPVKDQGWGLADLARLGPAEAAWAEDNARVPDWLARSFTEDVLGYNLASDRLWRELRHDAPELFHGVGLREGILRVYSDQDVLEAHVERQHSLTDRRFEILSADRISARHPALAAAHRAGAFVGGIEVNGFTVQVHRFLGAVADAAERAGAVFHWGRPVDALVPGEGGAPDAISCRDGETVRADHYVLSTGAYGEALLRGTASAGLIHGMVGAWLTLPDPGRGLRNSLKITRSGHTAADANVTVTEGPDGRSFLTVGSGYGWTGADPDNVDPTQLEALYAAVEDTASSFFPDAFDAARRSGLLERSRRYCVRPWTASSLPVFETARTAGGGLLLITGGHNTGGFAQAPVTAEAVASALRGESHPMHIDYHPNRLRMFYGQKDARLPA